MSKMQFSILNAVQITNHPTNDSPTKQQYSFPKSPRFQKIRAECQHAYYQQVEVRNKRATSFGYGIKSDFTKTSITSPAPNLYEKKSEFDKNKSVKTGKTFGLSRDQMKEFGHITPGPIKNPGVGNYQINRDLNKTSYTLRSRTPELYIPVFLGGKTTFLKHPGPGQYEQEQGITKDGKHFFSKYQNSGAPVINPPKSSRFYNEKRIIPGPNHYKMQTGMDKGGKYVLSGHKGQGTRAFSHDKRIPFTERISLSNFAPGPGSYRQTSDFGVYENTQKFVQTSSDFGHSGMGGNGQKHFSTQPDLSQVKKR